MKIFKGTVFFGSSARIYDAASRTVYYLLFKGAAVWKKM